MTDIIDTVSMHEIALELRDKEVINNKRYQELKAMESKAMGKHGVLNKKEAAELNKYEKEYDEDNYYRKILRYAESIFQYGSPMVKKDKGDEYFIPFNEAWLVKTMLSEYMSPFLKISRTKRSSQISFTDFIQFITRIEKAIENKYDNEMERNVELALLNLYTDYKRRKQIFQIKKDVENTISKDWQILQQLENTQLKIELLDTYRSSIQDFSVKWRTEIRKELDVEEAMMDEMIEENLKLSSFDEKGELAINEVLETDFQEMSIPYIEEDDITVWKDVLSEEEVEELNEKMNKWEKIFKYEK